MEAACGVDYMDTANYEPEDISDPQWKEVYDKDVRRKDSLRTLITPGSGHIKRSLRKRDLRPSLVPVLIRE